MADIKSPAYLWYPGDVFLSARVEALSPSEECWYRRALDRSWMDNGISADPAQAAARIGKKCTVKAAEMILKTFFEPSKKEAQKMINPRQEIERKKWKKKSAERSKAGIKSGAKRRELSKIKAEQLLNNSSTFVEHSFPIPISISNQEKTEEKKEELSTESASASAAPPKRKTKKERDPRLDHPAIIVVHETMARYPAKGLWDRIIREIGAKPDVEFIRANYELWLSVNGNPMNLEKWLFGPNRTGKGPEVYGSKNEGVTNGNFTNGRKPSNAEVVDQWRAEHDRIFGSGNIPDRDPDQ